MSSPIKVGFLGLGAMGLPMARNLLKAGIELHVMTHRNRDPVEILKNEGAHEQGSLCDVTKNSQILISILPTDKEMESVLLSEQVITSLPKGATLIEMTSGSPAMMKKISNEYEKRGIAVVDGPVSGGTIGAENGTLTVMVGANQNVLDRVRPVLEAMATNIYLVGEIGAGKAIKAINQMLASIHMVATAEALALAEKLNIEPERLKEVIGTSSGASWMLMNKLDSLVERNFEPGFKLALMKKDVKIAVDEAQDLTLPLAESVLQIYSQLEGRIGHLDFSAVGEEILK